MSDFLKNNPTSLRHCILYEFLRKNPVEQSFIALRKTVGPGIIEREEFYAWSNQFKQGIFDINDDNGRITDMRDVLRSDKYALRACILYESIKYIQFQRGFSSFQLWPNSKVPDYNMQCNQPFFFHKNFCKVIGDDVMEYKEFEFWFYRFLKGEFDLNYEREEDKNIKELTDMPIDIMKEIMDYLNIINRANLVRTSRSFHAFVEDQKLFCKTLKLDISINTASISLDRSLRIDYTQTENGCHKSSKRRLNQIHRLPYWEKALVDFRSIVKNPKLHLDTLEIKLDKKYEPARVLELEAALKFGHHLNVRKISLQTHTFKSLLKVLPSLKPGYLTTISTSLTYNKWIGKTHLVKIEEMEQWKQAKYFDCNPFYNSIQYLFHFKQFDIFYEPLTIQDVRQMKEILFKSPDFEKGIIRFANRWKISILEQEFGKALQEDPYLTYHYQIPNSVDYFEIIVDQLYMRFAVARKKV